MSGQLWLREDLRQWCGDRDPFQLILGLEGEAVREVAERSTIRATLGNQVFYIKRHYGVGWMEILKNLVTGKTPVLDAGNEFAAARRLHEAGLGTLPLAGFGVRGRNPARRESFLISDELRPIVSLEQYCLRWPELPPSIDVKRGLIKRVATIARGVHGLGINHQDFYICHFLLDTQVALTADNVDVVPIYLVDLHRAGIRSKMPVRWLVKDLAGLYYSTFDIGLTRRDVLRFLRVYFDLPLREVMGTHKALLDRCEHRAHRLYAKAKRKGILPRQLAEDGRASL
jgi:heptose I phosphotransferase